MAIPTYDEFIEPLLRYLATQSDPISTATVYGAVADAVGLSAEDRAVLLPSATQRVFQNRIGWAHDRLKRMGLSSSPKTQDVAAHRQGASLRCKAPIIVPGATGGDRH